MLVRNVTRPGLRPRVFMIRPPHLGEKRPPPPPLLIQRVLPQARLLLAPPRGLREPKAPPVLLQVLYPKDLVVVAQQARDLVVVPRAKFREVKIPPRLQLLLRALTQIF